MRDHAGRQLAFAAAWLSTLLGSVASAAGDPSASAPSETTIQPSQATPEKGDTKKKAKEHFATGLKFYEDGDYSLALIEFERAYSYVPDFRVLYNIGQVSIQLTRYARAAQALQQYLASGGNKIPAARATAVQGDLKMLENRTAHLMVKCNIDGADVYLDDTLLGKTPMNESILVDAGEHRVQVQKPGYISRSEPLVLAGRDESTLELELTEERPIRTAPENPIIVPVPSQAPYATPVAPMPAPTPRKNEMLYVGWGATGLLTIGWAVTGYMGIKAADDLHNALKYTATESDLQSLKSKARGWLLAADIIGATALVTGGTTLYFTLKRPAREQSPVKSQVSDLQLRFSGGAAQLSTSF
jgi:tetratricopeptide (TPR) repeat protein